jgi:hypothetical protein
MKLNDNLKVSISEDDKLKLAKATEILNETTFFKEIKKQIDKQYLAIGIIVLILISILVAMLIFKMKLLYVILYMIIAIPLGLMSALITLIKLFKDRKSILNIIKQNVSRNIIRSIFFYDNKKAESIYFIYSGFELEYEKGMYIVDEKAIYSFDNTPTIFFKHGIPNPLIFDFTKELNIYLSTLDKTTAKGLMGQDLDLSYSSDNLKKLKQDKFFEELHRNAGDDIFKFALLIFGFVAFLVVMALIFRGKGG